MKRTTTILFSVLLCAILASEVSAQPSVTSGTGTVGFTLSSIGRLRIGKFPLDNTNRNIDRLSLNAALNKNNVFDYYQDENSTTFTAQYITLAGVDTAVETLGNNTYSNLPPNISVRHTVMAWKNTNFLIVRFGVRNDSTVTQALYLGAVLIPKVDNIYGGDTNAYDAASKIAYTNRSGTALFWGLKLLGKNPYSVKIRDWDNYSSDPSSDAADDSVRYDMTAGTGFDAPVTAGSNGSIFNVNAGQYSIPVAGTATVYYAVAYGTTFAEMQTAMNAAGVKYTQITTSVHQTEAVQPAAFSLGQNYPNPFNPTTEIQFSLKEPGPITLTVQDLLGRTVQTLAEGRFEAGTYRTFFNASRLTSGIYYYTLHAGQYRETRRMMHVK